MPPPSVPVPSLCRPVLSMCRSFAVPVTSCAHMQYRVAILCSSCAVPVAFLRCACIPCAVPVMSCACLHYHVAILCSFCAVPGPSSNAVVIVGFQGIVVMVATIGNSSRAPTIALRVAAVFGNALLRNTITAAFVFVTHASRQVCHGSGPSPERRDRAWMR